VRFEDLRRVIRERGGRQQIGELIVAENWHEEPSSD
jgi:hypothetical protein